MTPLSQPAYTSLFRQARLVLFDFDGPLCDVFAGYPARQIARELEAIAGEHYKTDDPLDVLRTAFNRGRPAVQLVEDALIAAEARAVELSKFNREGLDLLHECVARDVSVGVLSNNSAQAIEAFLRNVGLIGIVSPLVGRPFRRPDLMKPNPWPMEQALGHAAVAPAQALFIGDSLSDIEVARSAGVPCIAYANKAGKRELFEGAGATAVVDRMVELVTSLQAASDR